MVENDVNSSFGFHVNRGGGRGRGKRRGRGTRRKRINKNDDDTGSQEVSLRGKKTYVFCYSVPSLSDRFC